MIAHKLFATRCLVIISILYIAGCEYENPPAIWNPDVDLGNLPVLNQIDPPDSAVTGINEIKLMGQYFSAVNDSNRVYFSGTRVFVKESTPTQIIVYRPNVVSDTIRINVVVPKAFSVAEYFPYKLEAVQSAVNLASIERQFIYAVAIGSNDDIYLASRRRIYRVGSDSLATEYASTTFNRVEDMKMGPEGYLYLVVGTKIIYRIDPVTKAVTTYASVDNTVTKLEFDQNNNIYAAKNRGLYVVNTDASSRKVGQYDSTTVSSIRVYSGHVYVSGQYKGEDSSIPPVGIWRNEILNNQGDLGNNELMVDWMNRGDSISADISDLTFSADGDMYVGMSNHEQYPILVFHPNADGTYTSTSCEPLYYDPSILEPVTDNIVWGNGQILYLNRGTTFDTGTNRLMRLGMGKNGAPYYGRN
jgi:hypothetical protein